MCEMSQNYETCYSTLSNMRVYGQQFYNFLDYFIHFSLSLFLSRRRRFRFEAELADWSLPIWSRARRLKLANLKFCSPIWSSARPGAVANLCSSSSTVAVLCSSSSTALVADLAADGWLSLVIDWSVGLGFCWRFWVFFVVEVFGFGICWRIRWLWL